MKKILFALLFLVSTVALAACNDTATDPVETPVDTPVDTPVETPVETPVDSDPGKTYDIDIDTLDLGGKIISYYTHVSTEDNPFAEGYVGTDKEAYQTFLTNLQQTYNFTLSFKGWTDYNNRITDIASHVLGGGGSAIVRSPELEFMLDLISAGYLSNITHVANALKDEYAVNDWQVQAGTVQDNVFAIQNKDGVEYVELLVYNKTLMTAAGIEKTPTQRWIDGEWTLDTMGDYLNQLRLEYGNSPYPMAITPYHIAMYGPAANGSQFVTSEGNLNLLNTATFDVIYKYKDWYDYGYIRPMNFNMGYILKHSIANAWANQDSVFGVAMMWQLEGFAQNVSFEYGIVPFPQADGKTKDDYYTAINPGDLQMVTIGNDADEVATIMFLINEFHKERREEELQTCLTNNPEATAVECQAIENVQKYLRLSNEIDIAQAEEVFSFLQGTLEYNSIRSNDLAYLNGEILYVQAVQDYFQSGGSPRNYIDAIIPQINEN
ncbi:MAG: hypothetical protein RG740_02255, partial [Acholeplasmataceae bacterium]|nr:hypothetical protein [Acholeplasmataceae bacterium]